MCRALQDKTKLYSEEAEQTTETPTEEVFGKRHFFPESFSYCQDRDLVLMTLTVKAKVDITLLMSFEISREVECVEEFQYRRFWHVQTYFP